MNAQAGEGHLDPVAIPARPGKALARHGVVQIAVALVHHARRAHGQPVRQRHIHHAVDAALWDLQAKRTGVPAWQRANAPGWQPVDSAVTIGIRAIPDYETAARERAGFSWIKVKVGPGSPLEAVAAVRRGAPDAHLIGMRESVMQSTVAPLLEDAQGYFAHIKEVLDAHQMVSAEYEFRFADGRIVTDRSAVVEGASAGLGIGRVWIYEDVTAERRISAQLISMAERDPLTNIFNRRRFHEELERTLADAARRGVEVGLLGIDLDGFKPVNDAFGHQAGDEVLIKLVDRVASIVRRNEMFFRIGGDEFAVLVPDTRASELSELANRLCEAIAGLRFEFDGQPASVTASIGIALYPENGLEAQALVAAADEAMYCSKAGGRNCWTLSARLAAESVRMPVSSSDEPDSKED